MAAMAATLSLVSSLPAGAQSATRYKEPAEFPPASFTGSQYVDSRGCVFVRAGISGVTTWVPRVKSSRENLCGAQPTFAKGESAQTVVSGQAALPPGATLITVPQAAGAGAASVTAAPVAPVAPPAAVVASPRPAAPAPRQATARAERPGAPMRTIASITTPPTIGLQAEARAKAGTQTRAAQAAPMAAPGTARVNRCASAAVRCGPQVQDPAITPQTRVVPRHLAEAQAQAAAITVIPQGYRLVWEDDRLNPRRAQGTLEGKAAMDLIWTQQVPRRLIDRRSGRDMTAYNPNLTYPYTDLATQTRSKVLADRGVTLSSRSAAPAPAPMPKAKAVQVAAPARVVAPQQVSISGKMNAAAPKVAAKAGAGRYVQVGAFANPDNAAAATRRLQAAGLPGSSASLTRKGQPLRLVLAGPFSDPAALAAALGVARAAGFRDAFPRN